MCRVQGDGQGVVGIGEPNLPLVAPAPGQILKIPKIIKYLFFAGVHWYRGFISEVVKRSYKLKILGLFSASILFKVSIIQP